MKSLALLIPLVFAAASVPARAEAPHGSLLELHACEVYAGGCIVSSQTTLEGRYLLRAWNFAGGEFRGTSLRGLSAVLLECSDENLALPGTMARQAVVYLPASATEPQRAALTAWLQTSLPDLKGVKLQKRVAPIRTGAEGGRYHLSVGDFVSVATAPLEECETGACGEALWYTPRTKTSVFSVALNRVSTINEPLLDVRWRDAGKRSVFVGRFGDDHSNQQFVSATELCGSGARLF